MSVPLFRLPLEAKRTDAHHAVIFDADGTLIAKMAGNEYAFERAARLCLDFNRAWGHTDSSPGGYVREPASCISPVG